MMVSAFMPHPENSTNPNPRGLHERKTIPNPERQPLPHPPRMVHAPSRTLPSGIPENQSNSRIISRSLLLTFLRNWSHTSTNPSLPIRCSNPLLRHSSHPACPRTTSRIFTQSRPSIGRTSRPRNLRIHREYKPVSRESFTRIRGRILHPLTAW